MSQIDLIFERAKRRSQQLAEQLFGQYAGQATADAQEFLQLLKPQWERLAGGLAAGEIDQAEFASLIQGQASLARMAALTQAGLATVQIETFRNGIVDVVVEETRTGTDSPGPQFMP